MEPFTMPIAPAEMQDAVAYLMQNPYSRLERPPFDLRPLLELSYRAQAIAKSTLEQAKEDERLLRKAVDDCAKAESIFEGDGTELEQQASRVAEIRRQIESSDTPDLQRQLGKAEEELRQLKEMRATAKGGLQEERNVKELIERRLARKLQVL